MKVALPEEMEIRGTYAQSLILNLSEVFFGQTSQKRIDFQHYPKLRTSISFKTSAPEVVTTAALLASDSNILEGAASTVAECGVC